MAILYLTPAAVFRHACASCKNKIVVTKKTSAKNVTQNFDLIILGKLFIYRHNFPVRTPGFHESRYSIII